MLGDVSVGENSQNKAFQPIKKCRDCLLEKVNMDRIEKRGLENTLLEKKIQRKMMARSLVDLKRSSILPEQTNHLLMSTIEDFSACLLWKSTTNRWATDNLFNVIAPVRVSY